MKRIILSAIFLCAISFYAMSQNSIYQLMERNDLSINEVEKLAAQYFEKVGTGQGTGYKQYSRWLYERKFHLDENGYLISPEKENSNFQKFASIQKNNKTSTIIWNELGPQYWQVTTSWSPGLGRITSVAVHPSDTTIIYVSSPGGGIWKSSNSGKSWKPLIDNINSAWMDVYNLCIDPNNQNTIYAALQIGGIIKSVDAGNSWSTTGNGPIVSKKVVVHPKNSKIVFATANTGIWRSTNEGVSWTKVSSSNYGFEDIEFNPTNPNKMYASRRDAYNYACVWISSDNGINWTNNSLNNGIKHAGRTLLAVSPADPGAVYAVFSNGENLFGALYKSTDSGATYKLQVKGSSSNNFFGYQPDGTSDSGQAEYDMAICVNPKNADEVHIAGILCFKSVNGGINFTAETDWTFPNSIGYNHADVHALEYVKNTIYSGSDGGIFKSVNKGDDWINLSTGLGIRQLYRIACSKTNASIITSGAQDNGSGYRRANGSWVDWLGADGMDNIISPTDPNIAIATSQFGNIYKTTNSGSSKTNLTRPNEGNWVTPIAMHPTNHDTIFGGWNGIYKSVNGGVNWAPLLSGSTTGKLTNLAISKSNPQYIYGNSGMLLFRTSNGGASWSTDTVYSQITSIFVSPTNPEKIWITCISKSSQVLVSTDMGNNFTDISSGLPAISARSVVVEDNPLEGVYVGMNVGVYYRDNKNTSWVLHGEGLPLVAINEVEIQESSGKLRVATYGRGTWESDLQSNEGCKAPSKPVSKPIKPNSLRFSWNKTSEIKNFTFQYKLSSDSLWTSINTKDTFLTITNVNLDKDYDWRVRTNCPMNSAFIKAKYAKCGTPIGLSLDSIRFNSVKLSWKPVVGSINYLVDYKEYFSSQWETTANINDTVITLKGLNAMSKYDWRVKSNCPFDSGSSTTSTFTTPNCGLVKNLSSKNLLLTSTLFSWSMIKGALDYTFELKPSTNSIWERTFTTTDTFTSMIALTKDTKYDWHVKPNCSNTYSQSTFTTGLSNISISEYDYNSTSLSVFPIPTDNLLKYQFELKRDMKDISVLVLNIEGKEIYRAKTNHKKGNVINQLNTSAFKNGIYFLIIITEDSTYTKKFVILK
jgi:photosystem II stability/assembly factor-like uncharacterized protein